MSVNVSFVFTNGVFDLLHVGHVKVLQRAYWEALQTDSLLIVGVNSDESVRRIKGHSPIFPCSERVELVQSISGVFFAEAFDEDTPSRLIDEWRPHTIVKGGDYASDQVVGSERARVIIVPTVPGRSSSTIVERIRRDGYGNS
jgi:rfaE bifunctional protein nucleotidyltransferase chain/domain